MTSSPNSVEAQVLRVERAQLGAAKRRREPEQQQRAIAQTRERAGLHQLDHPRERLQLEGLRLTLWAHSPRAPDPGQHRGDGGRLARDSAGPASGALRRWPRRAW